MSSGYQLAYTYLSWCSIDLQCHMLLHTFTQNYSYPDLWRINLVWFLWSQLYNVLTNGNCTKANYTKYIYIATLDNIIIYCSGKCKRGDLGAYSVLSGSVNSTINNSWSGHLGKSHQIMTVSECQLYSYWTSPILSGLDSLSTFIPAQGKVTHTPHNLDFTI